MPPKWHKSARSVRLESRNLLSALDLWKVHNTHPPPTPSSRPLIAGPSRRKSRRKPDNLAAHLAARWGQGCDITTPYSTVALSDHALAVLEALYWLSLSHYDACTCVRLQSLLPFVPDVSGLLKLLKGLGLAKSHKGKLKSSRRLPGVPYSTPASGLLRLPKPKPRIPIPRHWTCTRLALLK